ncbi:glycosyltransferase family 4 protein [Christiangramia sabulilitoris]|uniref:Glycosyltransferase family 4 protein n=1 Tax=Christiangramia sabulilitoris TaxID=2583991 RepID=A0A550I6C2_9FLAO|nr:glycosyltransferase family 4 protein [Christiangramia sabulilitoris]TRO66519.1 glycosyltransferase family 4 protein [Christiangramia sabulilitoris]
MPKLLIIGYVWPEPNSSAAGSRMLQLIEFFIQEKYNITFATTARTTDNMVNLETWGVEIENIKLNDPQFDIFLEDLKPDVVLFDRFMIEEQFGWRVDQICPYAIKILDTEDLHFLRKARHQAYKDIIATENILKNLDLTKREIAAIYRCDLSLIISEPELELLQAEFGIPEAILFYLPFMLKPVSEKQQSALPGFEERKDFISIGNFLHEPNWNAVLFLKEKIWPELRKELPGTKMNIYGAYPSQKVLNLHNPSENFMVHGWADNSAEVMKQARVCLAPIQFGAGLKGKLVEAMQNGTPSVTTMLGSEGISKSGEWNGFISDDVPQFVQKAYNLYSNQQPWNEKQKIGFTIFNTRFNIKLHQQRFQSYLNILRENLEKHREHNFTGQMLKYHFHKSTYFMSRFIEEKNRHKK